MTSRSIAEASKSTLVEKAVRISKDAILGGGWSYPLLGVIYFISHPSLYRAVAPIIFKCVLVSIGITLALVIFTYLPQVAFCALFSGPLAFVAAATMVLGEAYAIILVVSKAFFLGRAQDLIFDAVLVQQGNERLVSRGREVKSSSGIKKFGKSIAKPLNRFSKEGIMRYLISLPLNALPIVGTLLFLLYNGIKVGPGFHRRYFQLKGLDASSREAFVDKRKGAYTAFGATALALNLVPLVGLVFSFTSTVGAALWASELEKKDSDTSTGASSARSVNVVPAPSLVKNEVPVKVEYEGHFGRW